MIEAPHAGASIIEPYFLAKKIGLSYYFFIWQPVSAQGTSTDFAVTMPAGASKA